MRRHPRSRDYHDANQQLDCMSGCQTVLRREAEGFIGLVVLRSIRVAPPATRG